MTPNASRLRSLPRQSALIRSAFYLADRPRAIVRIEPGEVHCLGERPVGTRDSGPESSSSGVMTEADAKVLQALEAMKSHHDFDSTVCLESLGSVRKRFSIPNEYVLHAPGSGQRPYHPYPGGFGISIDTLEAGLRFPLHPVIGECLSWYTLPDRWQSGEASATYIRGVLIPRLASDLYTLPSEVLMDEASKAMVLNQHYQAALFDRVHDAGRVITSLDSKVSLLRQELQDLKEGENPDAVAAAEDRAAEAQSLAEHLRVELDEANGQSLAKKWISK
ncbi:hypothetical protein B296_00024335 [Ensete ventricosum]|uniref:Uncharacterized protein n=1 Tax=Ensete ventricosum TaxID=4639 RepID=A0A426ZK09_ENSVE|nr:hypothetical protein B296_00024335 [Ensete ventricosum]